MEISAQQMEIIGRQSFRNRIAYLLSQHAMVIVDPSQTPNPNSDDLEFARKIISGARLSLNPSMSIIDALMPVLISSPNVRSTVQEDSSGDAYITVTDAALASQIATYWNFFATSGF